MNTKIYKRVHSLAESMMKAAQKEDQITFDALYGELKNICEEHEGTEKDHPVQWETLGDFTEDYSEAASIYRKALVLAENIKSNDFCSSVRLALANMLLELGSAEEAVEILKVAKVNCEDIEDKSLKNDIHNLLHSLVN